MSSISALFLPPGFGPRDSIETGTDAETLIRALRDQHRVIAARPVLQLTRQLGQVGRRFLDPQDSIRSVAEERVAAEAGLSPSVARTVVAGMARDWTPDRLERLVRSEFQDPAVLDQFRPDPFGGRLRATGGTFAFHIGAGSVPGVTATSMIRSLLVKCPVLLKPGRGDVELVTLFARALGEADPELAGAIAILYWPRGQGELVQDAALREADRVVAYGSSDLIRVLRGRLPPTTPLVAYHHRLSVGAVASEFLATTTSAQAIARHAARAVATFDQRGCVSPQIIWVEDGAEISPVAWAELLFKELGEVDRELPPGPTSLSVASARRQQKAVWELKEASKTGHRLFAGSGNGGAVLFDPDPFEIPASTVTGRTVIVKPIEQLERLPEALGPARRVLQTLALAASPDRMVRLAESLASTGITRVTSFEEQPWPPAWWKHDGMGPLEALVRWVTAP